MSADFCAERPSSSVVVPEGVDPSAAVLATAEGDAVALSGAEDAAAPLALAASGAIRRVFPLDLSDRFEVAAYYRKEKGLDQEEKRRGVKLTWSRPTTFITRKTSTAVLFRAVYGMIFTLPLRMTIHLTTSRYR